MKTKHCFLLVSICLLGYSCEQDDETPSMERNIHELPLLTGQNRIGILEGFNTPYPPATQDSIEIRWEEAIQAGMTVGRLQIDWPDLESSPLQYNTDELQYKLDQMQNDGLQTFLLISAFDSEGPVLPDDLAGRDLDDPLVIERFKLLLDWVVPMLVEKGGYLISISNEADNSFEEQPDLHLTLRNFTLAIRAHVQSIDSRMAVTVTFAQGNLNSFQTEIADILDACDVACFNFYGSKSIPVAPFAAVRTEEEIIQEIEKMILAAAGKHVVIQELGMLSGSTTVGSSEEAQRKFFEVFFQQMGLLEEIRVANVWQMVDWSEELTDTYIQAFLEDGTDQAFVDQFREALETIGLINFEDGSKKSAWDECIFWLNEYK